MSTGLDPITQKVHSFIDVMTKNKEKFIGGVLAVALLVGGFFGYQHYRHGVQVAAHKDFVHSLKYYDAPVKTDKQKNEDAEIVFETENEKWEKVATVFQQGYKNNSRSYLAPMFKAFYAQALLSLGKVEQGRKELTDAIDAMNVSQIKQAYVLKMSLINLDSQDEKIRQAGLEQLKKIAFDRQNFLYGLALYHLGHYAWVNKDFEQAKSHWQQFIVKFGDEKSLDKEVKIVRSKLDLVSV